MIEAADTTAQSSRKMLSSGSFALLPADLALSNVFYLCSNKTTAFHLQATVGRKARREKMCMGSAPLQQLQAAGSLRVRAIPDRTSPAGDWFHTFLSKHYI